MLKVFSKNIKQNTWIQYQSKWYVKTKPMNTIKFIVPVNDVVTKMLYEMMFFLKDFKKEYKDFKSINTDVNVKVKVIDELDKISESIDPDAYIIGHPQQYPHIAGQNIARWINDICTRLFVENKFRWTREKLKNNDERLGIDITTTIDYYPFTNTLGKKQKLWIKKEYQTSSESDNLDDCIDTKLPYFVNKNQELLMFRDIHNHPTGIHKINKIMKVYKPTKIILECHPTEKLSYHKNKLISFIWCIFGISNLSYSMGACCTYAIRNGVPVLLCDLMKTIIKYSGIFYNFADIMSMNSIAATKDRKERKKINREIQKCYYLKNGKMSKYVANYMTPHLSIAANFRDDFMYLGMNECNEERILLVVGAAHSFSIGDRLTGKIKVHSPIKKIRDNVVMFKLNEYGYTGQNEIYLTDEEKKSIIDSFGVDIATRMNVFLDTDSNHLNTK